MPDPTPEELAEIARARGQMFRPVWFARLFRGDLALGETFWGGHLGMQLVLMPLWLLLIVLLPAVAPGAGRGSILAFFVLSGLVSALVTRAVIIVAPRSDAGIWRWVAIAVSLLITLQSIALLVWWLNGDL
ncbi:hypothetical protein [Primorskyibacter sp. 2E233]|uniref:hypothetical protein n=1 Tax=Primorskyibacter sp. 2E233 TaxID=3413431 RepID=UPI003BF01474